MNLNVDTYQVDNPILKRLIKFFWVIEKNDATFDHKILPQKNIDLLLNFSTNLNYSSNNNKRKLSKLYFNGITDNYKYNWVHEKGKVEIIGISFYPTGLFPFIKTPVSEFKNHVIDLDLIYSKFSNDLIEKVNSSHSVIEKIKIIESNLLKMIDTESIISDRLVNILSIFNSNINQIGIEQFCSTYGIHKRQLERIFNKYIGTNPKSYIRISRFQNVIKQMFKHNYSFFTDLAFDNGYYDQNHFIKDFKDFTGSTPSQFANKNTSVKEIVTYS